MLGLNQNKIDIQDILYGGFAGQMPLPELLQPDSPNLLLSGSKLCQNPSEIKKPEVISYSEAISATMSGETDIRPRVYDSISKDYLLVDTGSMCSVTKPASNATVRPDLLLESVDGTNIPCFGTKPLSLRLGRKEYHIDTVVSNTTDNILGMDFINKYGFEFRRGEFGDLYLYDPKANISIWCQFVKTNNKLPRTASLKLASTFTTPESASLEPWSHPSLDVFAVSAINTSDTKNQKPIAQPYKQLLDKYPTILHPNFTDVKHSVRHTVNTGDTLPIRSKARPLLPGSPKAINGKAAWDEMVRLGIVEKVNAADHNFWSFPLVLQTKADGSERPCGDFRLLNDVTIQEAGQLPDINHFASSIKKSKIFSKVDLSKAFHFIPIRDEDQNKCCVNTPWGLFKFKRMAFGLKNAPITFAKFAEEVFSGIPNLYVYLDDLLLYTDTHEHHLQVLEQVFQRLDQYGLALALPKCVFGQTEVDFLGYRINNKGITPLSNKTQSIVDFPKPTTQKQLLKFLGMLNFYRKTLPSLKNQENRQVTPAEILQPLYRAATLKMQKKHFESYWSENKLDQSFSNAKLLLKNCITLSYPNPNNPLALSCDASDLAVGAVLEEYQDGEWKPIGFWSRHLPPSKQQWSCFRRELLAIQGGIRNFKQDIYGRELIIFTDHRSILGAMASPNLQVNDPVASRALSEIAQYSQDIRYKPGKLNLLADALSRPSGTPPGLAYCPEVDVVASVKKLVTTELAPSKILQAQEGCQSMPG